MNQKLIMGSIISILLLWQGYGGSSGGVAKGEISNSDTENPTPVMTILHVPDDYASIRKALDHAEEDDTILLAPGIYAESLLEVDKNNITIASKYLTTGDESYIESTVIKGNSDEFLLTALEGKAVNLKIIGLTITHAKKGVVFEEYGEIHHCKVTDMGTDAISFETYAAGGKVNYCHIENPGDEAIDIDAKDGGTFLITSNEFINPGDDCIEIRLFKYSGSAIHYSIHDNTFSGCQEDGIQLIDYDDDSDRKFDIYRNIFRNIIDVGIGTTINGNTTENKQGSYLSEPINIYNNYFYSNDYHITGGDNMIILNNIFEGASGKAIYKADGNSITDYNLFYNNATDTDNSTLGSHNLYINAQRNSDFTLQQGSPAIDAGTANYIHHSETVLKIPDNAISGSNPDIGRYEYGLDAISTLNQAPIVYAGQDQILTSPNDTIHLDATVIDDGLPNDSLHFSWTGQSGPGSVSFQDHTAEDTAATFLKHGIYRLKLTADDGEETRSNDVIVHYVKDSTSRTIHFSGIPVSFEAEDYSYLYGVAEIMDDSSASNGKALNIPDGAGAYGFADYIIDTDGKNLDFSVKIRMRGIDEASNSIKVTFFGSNGDVSKTVEVTDDGDYHTQDMDGTFTTTAGVWRLRIEALEDGVSWDKIELRN